MGSTAVCAVVLSSSAATLCVLTLAVGLQFLNCSPRRWFFGLRLFLITGICALILIGNPARRNGLHYYAGSLNGRTKIWTFAMPLLMKHPILGYGLDQFLNDNDVRIAKRKQYERSVTLNAKFGRKPFYWGFLDNGYLDVLSSFGLAGVVLLIGAIALSGKRLLTKRTVLVTEPHHPFLSFRLGAFVVTILLNVTGGWYLAPTSPLFMLFIATCLSRIEDRIPPGLPAPEFV